MDPVSIFKALHDTKCLKFGSFRLKSGLVAPYYINLRRISLYPRLMNAVVSLTVDRFLTREALEHEQCQRSLSNSKKPQQQQQQEAKQLEQEASSDDADSQLDEDDELDDSDSSLPESPARERPLARDLDPILCGVPYGAIPLASAIAYKAQLPLLLERKEDKSYGDTECLMQDFNQDTRAASQEHQPAERAPKQRVILIEDVICSGESIMDTVQSLAKRNHIVEFVICIVDREENGLNLLLQEAGVRVLPLFNISAILRVLEATGRISNEQFLATRHWIAENKFTAINGYISSSSLPDTASNPPTKTPIVCNIIRKQQQLGSKPKCKPNEMDKKKVELISIS